VPTPSGQNDPEDVRLHREVGDRIRAFRIARASPKRRMEGTLIEGGDLAEPKKVKVPRTPWDMLRETPLDRGTRGTAQGTPRAAAAGLQNSAQFEVEPYSRQPPSAEKYCLTRGKLENEGWIMRFLVSWTLPHGESYRAAAARFLEGGGTPPAGVELIGRWHGGNGKGFAIAETDDAKALFEWFAEWNEFMDIDATPLVEDADAGAVLQSLYG